MRYALLCIAAGALGALAQGTAQSDACVADPDVVQGTICTYDTQAEDSTFVVPSGVNSLSFTVVGGQGGDGTGVNADPDPTGAPGAQVTLDGVLVDPGQTLYLYAPRNVGCALTRSGLSVRTARPSRSPTRKGSRAVLDPPSSTTPPAARASRPTTMAPLVEVCDTVQDDEADRDRRQRLGRRSSADY